MSAAHTIHIRVDDRVRLMSAVLAITPATDQTHMKKPHSAHAHARATRKHLAAMAEHPAVLALQQLLEKRAPLDAIFGYALRMRLPDFKLDNPPHWAPAGWDEQLADFNQAANLPHWWKVEASTWDKSLQEAARVFTGVDFHTFLKPFLGEIHTEFVFLPNISYPAEQEICVRVGNEITCIIPPRPAWGDSPPWPFHEDPGHLYRAALSQYVRLLLTEYLAQHSEALSLAEQTELPVSPLVRAQYPAWREQFMALFISGLLAIYLEDRLDAAEAKSYTLMESKVHGMAMLPGVVSVLRRYLNDQAAGKYQHLADFLPLFPKQLRVAKRIYSL